MRERCGSEEFLRLELSKNWLVALARGPYQLPRKNRGTLAMGREIALVASVRDVAPDVRAFRLVLEDERAVPFEPGGHLDVEVLVGGQVQTRSYSMFRLNDQPGLWIAVRHAPHGHGGSAYMWSQKAGMRLGVRRARNSLPVDYSANRYLLIAAGIGVTPIIAMARALHQAGKSVGMH